MKNNISKREIILIFIFLMIISLVLFSYSHEYQSLTRINENWKSQIATLDATNRQLIKDNTDLKSQVDWYNSDILNSVPPQIISINMTDLNGNRVIDGRWATVPEDGKIKLEFEVKGPCTQIDLFYTPTGTETYTLQKMIDSLVVSPGQDSVSYIWNVPKGTMCHVWAIAYNGDVARTSELINVYFE